MNKTKRQAQMIRAFLIHRNLAGYRQQRSVLPFPVSGMRSALVAWTNELVVFVA